MGKLIVVYHSGYGHTRLQAEAVHRGAASVEGIEAELWTTEEAIQRLDDLDHVDAIIFGCPTLMGNLSAAMKAFHEAAVRKWYTLAWRGKVAGGFTSSNSFSGDKLNTLIGLWINAMQHGMIWVGLGMLPAQSDPLAQHTVAGPGPEIENRLGSYAGPMAASFEVEGAETPGPGDLATAQAYGARVAELTLAVIRGRAAAAPR